LSARCETLQHALRPLAGLKRKVKEKEKRRKKRRAGREGKGGGEES